MEKLSDETLVAYVDGELGAERVAEVEAVLAKDEEARRTVQIFRESAAAVEGAFDEPMYQDVPPALLKAIETPGETAAEVVDLANRRESQERTQKWRISLPLAASIALAVGLGGGYQLSTVVDRWQSGPGDGPVVADATIDDSVLGQVLETTASGDRVAWHNPATGRQGEITPVSTFKDKHGRFCREYEKTEASPGTDHFAFGITCRGADGNWQTEVFVAESLFAPPEGASDAAGDAYVPAADDNAGLLDALLDSLMAGPALTADQEEALIGSKWR